MWIFAPGGLLMPSTFPPEKVAPGYLDAEGTYDLQIRVRAVSHLENFIRDYAEPLGLSYSAIQLTPEMDYNARLYMSRQDFAIAMAAMVLDIDYRKFKPTAEDRNEDGTLKYAGGREYHSVLNSIWGTVCRLGRPGGSWGTYSATNPNGYKPQTTGRYADWWKDRLPMGRTTRFTDQDDYTPGTRDYRDWWDDEEFGTGTLLNEVGMGLDDYTPDSEERRQDALLDVAGIPASQWDEYLTPEQLALVKEDREELLSADRHARRMGFLGRRKRRGRHASQV